MVAAPGVVAGDEVQVDVLHVGADFGQFVGHMVGHGLIVDVDVHVLTLRQGLDEEMVGRIDGLNLSGPGVGVLGIGEPRGLVLCPLGGHIVALFFGSHSIVLFMYF